MWALYSKTQLLLYRKKFPRHIQSLCILFTAVKQCPHFMYCYSKVLYNLHYFGNILLQKPKYIRYQAAQSKFEYSCLAVCWLQKQPIWDLMADILHPNMIMHLSSVRMFCVWGHITDSSHGIAHCLSLSLWAVCWNILVPRATGALALPHWCPCSVSSH